MHISTVTHITENKYPECITEHIIKWAENKTWYITATI